MPLPIVPAPSTATFLIWSRDIGVDDNGSGGRKGSQGGGGTSRLPRLKYRSERRSESGSSFGADNAPRNTNKSRKARTLEPHREGVSFRNGSPGGASKIPLCCSP